ncbi:hypothetical protein [Paenibacillus sp. UNC496MF]|uniref:hypothetical protein n=1 Tax=Paenibacillus sp. UNC496MF TaxID=1502753 RepID=UPI000B854B63|nr:hypothetical protein [Paenibacillus sp. UNC496MF]
MAKIGVIYTESGYYGELTPVWMIFDWSDLTNDIWQKTLYIPLSGPFEQLELDDTYDELTAITVPLSAFTRRTDKEHYIGVHMPTVAAFAKEHSLHQAGRSIDIELINRLVMRISDIEDALLLDVRFHIQNGGFTDGII